MRAHLSDGYRSYPLRPGPNAIGRSVGPGEIQIEDELLSRRHAWVVGLGDGSWVLVDRRSRNGVRIHGARVQYSLLRDGDELTLGSGVWIFRAGAAPGVAAAASASLRRTRFRELLAGTLLETGATPLGRQLRLRQEADALLAEADPTRRVTRACEAARELLEAPRAAVYLGSAEDPVARACAPDTAFDLDFARHFHELALLVRDRGRGVRVAESCAGFDHLRPQGPRHPFRGIRMINSGPCLGAPFRGGHGVLVVGRQITDPAYRPEDLEDLVDLARFLGAGPLP